VVFGISVSMLEMGDVITFSLPDLVFHPLLCCRPKVFTDTEYLELRFNSAMRQIFAPSRSLATWWRFPGCGSLRRARFRSWAKVPFVGKSLFAVISFGNRLRYLGDLGRIVEVSLTDLLNGSRPMILEACCYDFLSRPH